MPLHICGGECIYDKACCRLMTSEVSQARTDKSQLFSLLQQVQHLTEAVAQLPALRDKEGTMSLKRTPVCWQCGKESNLRRDYQQQKVASKPTRWGRGQSHLQRPHRQGHIDFRPWPCYKLLLISVVIYNNCRRS